MILIVAWPNWNVRADRCRMFAATAEWLDGVFLLTSDALSPELNTQLHPNAQVIYPESPVRGWGFRDWARRKAFQIMSQAAHDNKPIVLHDLAIARLIPVRGLLRRRAKPEVRTVLSLYSPTYSNFRDRRWRVDSGKRLTRRQEYIYWHAAVTRLPLEYISCRLADVVTGNSEEICQDVVDGYRISSNRVYFMPTAVDLDYFYPYNAHKVDPPQILFCGKMLSRKGVFDLLEVGHRLLAEGRSFEMLFVGQNSLEAPQIAHTVKDLGLEGVTTFLPHQSREKIRKLMHRASLLVLPSYLEGSPRVVKEAMAAGCPVVTYDLPGTRQLDEAGSAIQFVALGNINALSQAIKRLLDSETEREHRGRVGLKLVRESYGTRSVAKQMTNMYKELFSPSIGAPDMSADASFLS